MRHGWHGFTRILTAPQPSTTERRLIGLILLVLLLGALCGCDTLKGAVVKSTVVEVRPAQTNVVVRVETNYVTSTFTVTNTVPGVTNVVLTTNLVVQAVTVTNTVTLVTPAVSYTSNAITSGAANTVAGAGNVAGALGVPFASTAASGLLAVSTLIFGFLNRRNAQKAQAEAEGHAETKSALETAKTVGQVLIENIESIRNVAKTVPGYTAEVDAKAMKVVQVAQRAAGVKREINELVEEHTA